MGLKFWKHAVGTTSACAENTTRPSLVTSNLGNYLRVRGEYAQLRWGFCGRVELPPRARRIHMGLKFWKHAVGTTSACAENTYYQYT